MYDINTHSFFLFDTSSVSRDHRLSSTSTNTRLCLYRGRPAGHVVALTYTHVYTAHTQQIKKMEREYNVEKISSYLIRLVLTVNK